jgi:hypothetical protein
MKQRRCSITIREMQHQRSRYSSLSTTNCTKTSRNMPEKPANSTHFSNVLMSKLTRSRRKSVKWRTLPTSMMNGFETGKLAKFSCVNWCCSRSIAPVSSLPGEHRTGSPEALVRSDTAAATDRGQQSPGDDVTPPIMLDFDSFRWSKGKPRTRYRVVTDSTDDDSDDLEPASNAAGGGTNGRRRSTRKRLEPPLSQTTPVTRSSSRISQKQ